MRSYGDDPISCCGCQLHQISHFLKEYRKVQTAQSGSVVSKGGRGIPLWWEEEGRCGGAGGGDRQAVVGGGLEGVGKVELLRDEPTKPSSLSPLPNSEAG
ncbi:hypothetical protein E2C01_028552 [Portunus trituberculatus]|uniref:Uncharacterized protein n=1 Tax=Portunus trituberculatus TaxID=210409 RepID=A0A5B7EPC3_PORTR|nr:hypothetical protein [Portunus trituberculatus]